MACSLYTNCLGAVNCCSLYETHLDTLSTQSKLKDSENCDCLCENRPCSHLQLVVIRETLV